MIVRLTLSLFLLGAPLAAQNGPVKTDSSSASASYLRNALWIDGSAIREGAGGRLISRISPFTVGDLESIVVGDSAKAYARVFAHQERQGLYSIFAAIGLAAGAVAINQESDELRPVPSAMLVSALVLDVYGVVRLVRSQRSAVKSVFWHNLQFAK
jgi:hypothetical protein